MEERVLTGIDLPDLYVFPVGHRELRLVLAVLWVPARGGDKFKVLIGGWGRNGDGRVVGGRRGGGTEGIREIKGGGEWRVVRIVVLVVVRENSGTVGKAGSRKEVGKAGGGKEMGVCKEVDRGFECESGKKGTSPEAKELGALDGDNGGGNGTENHGSGHLEKREGRGVEVRI